MLTKPFSVMNPQDWDRALRNTNGVECTICLAKRGGQKSSLYAAMQSLYEKDKMFALQYIAAEDGSTEIQSMKSNTHKLPQKGSNRRMCVIKMHLLDHLISVSILMTLTQKSYPEVKEGKWMRMARKTMKAATLHTVINEKLKYCMLTESGIEDGYHYITLKQEN